MDNDFEYININELKPAEYNPRTISEEEYNKLINSIREYGLVDPVIINLANNNRVIGGHQRLKALIDENKKTGAYENLLLLKRGDIGWVFTDNLLEVKDDTHEKALNIALNKISGEWDYPKLNDLLEEISLDTNFDIKLTGFDNLDIEELDTDLDDLDLGLDNLGDIENDTFTVIVNELDSETAEQLYNQLVNEGYACRIRY